MSDKFISLSRLTAIKNWIVGKLSDKQDTLVSGENIKMINNISLLGAGNIDIQGGGDSDVFIAQKGVTPVQDVIDAWNNKKIILLYKEDSNKYRIATYVRGYEDGLGAGGVVCYAADDEYYPVYHFYPFNYDSVTETYSWDNDAPRQYLVRNEQLENYALISFVEEKTAQATEDTLGTMKLNPSQSIDMDADGHLTVGGRMGQFSTTTGIYAPNNREPRMVADYDLLITDALGMNMTGNRALAVVSGLGITCKSAAAGATEYRVTNTYANQIQCKLAEGGFASRDEATSKIEQIVSVTSVTINGSSYTPSSNIGTGDIVIKTAETLNPSSAITSIRLFGTMGSYATIHTGNGIKSESGGRNLLLGGGVIKSGSSNDNCLVGNGIFSTGNGVAAFGRYHILRKNRGFFAGTGHDSSNAPAEGASAVGQYSYMDANTLFAVGVGSSNTDRKNAFEVCSDGVVLRSPNGTRYKVTVNNSGNLSATAV